MVMLMLHITIALTLTVSTVVVVLSAWQKRATGAYNAMLSTLGLTAVSGIGLLAIVPSSLGHLCMMMTAFTLSVIGVHYYYRARVLNRVEQI